MVDDAEKTTTRALYSGCRELVPIHTTFPVTNPAIVLDNADDATMRRIFQFLFEAILRKIGAAQAKLRWDEGMERNTDPEWLRTNFKADKQWVDQHIHSEKGRQGMLKLVLLGAQKYLTNGHQFTKVPECHADSDPFAQWMDEYTYTADVGDECLEDATVQLQAMHNCFKKAMDSTQGLKWFKQQLEAQSFKQSTSQRVYWKKRGCEGGEGAEAAGRRHRWRGGGARWRAGDGAPVPIVGEDVAAAAGATSSASSHPPPQKKSA